MFWSPVTRFSWRTQNHGAVTFHLVPCHEDKTAILSSPGQQSVFERSDCRVKGQKKRRKNPFFSWAPRSLDYSINVCWKETLQYFMPLPVIHTQGPANTKLLLSSLSRRLNSFCIQGTLKSVKVFFFFFYYPRGEKNRNEKSRGSGVKLVGTRARRDE